MGKKKGFFGQTNKKNDEILIERIEKLFSSPNYKMDKMTAVIQEFISRYKRIHSLTDKMRFQIKTHLDLHKEEIC